MVDETVGLVKVIAHTGYAHTVAPVRGAVAPGAPYELLSFGQRR